MYLFYFYFRVFRCTLNAIPQTSALLSKARLPLGILIHPFKDLAVSLTFKVLIYLFLAKLPILFTVIPLSIRTEKNNYYFLCPKTKGNYFHTVRKFRESLMPIMSKSVDS